MLHTMPGKIDGCAVARRGIHGCLLAVCRGSIAVCGLRWWCLLLAAQSGLPEGVAAGVYPTSSGAPTAHLEPTGGYLAVSTARPWVWRGRGSLTELCGLHGQTPVFHEPTTTAARSCELLSQVLGPASCLVVWGVPSQKKPPLHPLACRSPLVLAPHILGPWHDSGRPTRPNPPTTRTWKQCAGPHALFCKLVLPFVTLQPQHARRGTEPRTRADGYFPPGLAILPAHTIEAPIEHTASAESSFLRSASSPCTKCRTFGVAGSGCNTLPPFHPPPRKHALWAAVPLLAPKSSERGR
jgi:hypothetical protein